MPHSFTPEQARQVTSYHAIENADYHDRGFECNVARKKRENIDRCVVARHTSYSCGEGNSGDKPLHWEGSIGFDLEEQQERVHQEAVEYGESQGERSKRRPPS